MTNWTVVAQDIIIVLSFWSAMLWFSFDLRRKLFALLALVCLLVCLATAAVTIGDISQAAGYKAGDFWFLTREWRALPNRTFLMLAGLILALTLRFGYWLNGR